MRGCLWIFFGDGDGEFEGADFVGGAVEGADADEELAGWRSNWWTKRKSNPTSVAVRLRPTWGRQVGGSW
jgi:hypothetical protein